MKPKKKKAKKLKFSISKKRPSEIDFRADAIESKKFWNNAFHINIIDEAARVKNFNQLERFFENYMPGVTAADAAKIVTRHIRSNRNKSWTIYKILKDPEYHGACFELINWIDTKKGGAVAAYNHRVLKRFMMLTGYKKPPSIKTFQNEMTDIKDYFKLSRKKTGEYKRNQLKKAAARIAANKFPK